MTEIDFGWNALTESWREEEPLPFEAGDFKSVLRGRTRATMLVVLGELAITVGLIWVTMWLAGPATVGADAIFLTGLWSFWAVATGFAWWNRHGQWRLSVASSEDFVRLSLDRAKRKTRVVWFSVGLLVAQVVFVVTFWLFGREPGGVGHDFSGMSSLLITFVAAYSGWFVWYHRQARREYEHYAALARSMESARLFR